MYLADLRENYTRGALRRNTLTESPLTLFDQWLQDVIDSKIPDANAMTLATVDEQGQPTQRIVLLKDRPQDKFVFYTNYASNKAKDMAQNSRVSLHFPWHLTERQVMVCGVVAKLPDNKNDEYFLSRPKNSQLGAFVSEQSQPIDSRETLVANFKALQQEYAEKNVPRPNWGGYEVTPLQIEFWQGGEHRLHDRFRYSRTSTDAAWTVERLQP